MKTKELYLKVIVLTTFLWVSCSKKGGEVPQEILGDETAIEVTQEGYLPKVIALVYNSGDTVEHTFSYNEANQITEIEMFRISASNESHLFTEFKYDEKGLLTAALTENILYGSGFEIFFSYTEDGVMSDTKLVSNATQYETDFTYNGDSNIYGIEGDLGNFPMGWRFDAEGNLVDMLINSTFINLSFLENGKGIFHEVELQPALNIWHGLLFYLASWELYFFNKKDMDHFDTNNFSFSYGNKIRDEDGNLIAFKMTSDTPTPVIINYTVSYDGP